MCLLHGTPSQECLSCASGMLSVARVGRSGGRGRPLGQYVVEWKLMRVCWADRNDSRALRQSGPSGRSRHEHTSTQSARAWRTIRCGGSTRRQSNPSELAQRRCHRKLFYSLTMLLQGPPLLLLKTLERGNRFEAWSLLVERYDGANASRLHHILQCAGGFEVALHEWEHLVQRLEDLGQRPLARHSRASDPS